MGEMTGGCLCGAVRFRAAAVETQHHVCHCSMCRRWAGSPLFAAAVDRVTFEDTEHLGRFGSSDWAERGFCTRCGSSLFYRLKPADEYLMCVGAFDDPRPFKLVREIFVDHKPPGYTFAGDLEQATEADVFAQYAPPSSET